VIIFQKSDLWGVGCIFVELLTGTPAFPGVKDASDQLERIFKAIIFFYELIVPNKKIEGN